MDPYWWRSGEVELLREIEWGLRILAWQQTKDGSKGYNQPERLPLPWDPPAKDAIVGDVMEWDEAAAYFGWTEAMSRYFPD